MSRDHGLGDRGRRRPDLKRRTDLTLIALIVCGFLCTLAGAIVASIITVNNTTSQVREAQAHNDRAQDLIVREACMDRRRLQREHNALVNVTSTVFLEVAQERRRIAAVTTNPAARRVSLAAAASYTARARQIAAVPLSRCR